MTSTNDEKEVKSYQTSGPKGKSYFIELYKTLESHLSEEGTASERTKHLCEAWRRVHSLCQHSAPTTHPHLLSWLQRHTARAVLQTKWQSAERKDDRTNLQEAINCLIVESRTAAASRDGDSPPWEVQLVARGEWFKKVLENPWKHPVLNGLLNSDGTPPTDEEVLEWLKEERGVTFVMRLHTLVGEKCDDIAMTLASAVMERVRADTVTISDVEQLEEPKEKPENAAPNFGDRLKEEAGFTVDVWEMLTDIEFVLLNKRDSSRCIALAQQTPLRSAYPLIERLQSRLDTSPREKRLWKNCKEVAVLIAQVVIARCMMVPQCVSVARSALYCCTRSLARLLALARLPAAAATLAARAPTAAHLHTLAAAVDAQLAQKNDPEMKPFVCELYVRAITAGINELERLKLKTEKETEARSMEQTLANWFVQLGCVLASSDRVKCECALTAFSVHPSPQMYERIKAAPPLPSINLDVEQTSTEATNPEFGSWASDSRGQSNFVKTSETLNMKALQNQTNVLSTVILTEGEALGLSPDLCQDITVLLSGPRVKTLSWDMDRELLLENCRAYLERTHGGTKAVTTELKYLNLNPDDFQYLPEEDEDESNIYYGIEKGYEHLVEFQEPEDMWKDAQEKFDKVEKSYSSDEFSFAQPQRKKKTKKPSLNSDEDDPLSLVAETKRKEKKERPHSKERRSKEKKKTTGDPLDINEENQPKQKPKRERKKKAPKPADGSLSSLVGLKIGKSKKQATKVYPDSDMESLRSIPSMENVLYDGVFSIDDMRSPRSSHSSESMYNDLMANRRMMTNSQAHFNRPYRPPSLGGMRMASPSPSKSHSPSDHSRNNSPTYISDQVKESITKLIESRRQKALEVERKKPNAIIRHDESAMDKINISPKGVAIPEIPKSYINKQSDQMTMLKRQVDDILNKRNTNAIPSPVIQYASKTTSPEKPSQFHGPSRYNCPREDRMSERCFSTPPSTDKFLDNVSLISIYDKNEPSHSRNPYNKPSPSTDVFRDRQSNVDKMSSLDYNDYLHEFSLQSYNQHIEKRDAGKKVMRPISRVTPVIPNMKPELKTPQSAKQIHQKKPDGSLNTFSRLSYYKNKQTDMRKSQDMSQQDQPLTVASKLDGFIMNHLLQSQKSVKPQTYPLNDLQTPMKEKTQTSCRENPLLANILQGNLNTAQVQPKPTSPQKTELSEKDHNDLLLLLRQQNSLNNSHKSPAAAWSKVISSSTLNSPIASGSKAISSSTDAIYDSNTSLAPTSSQIGKPNTPHNKVNEGKMINVLSTSIIKTADGKRKEPKPKPAVTKTPTQARSKKTEPRPKKAAAKPRKNLEEWENVMNAISRQKTPFRGPNALDIALNKSSFEKAFEDSLRNPPTLFVTPTSNKEQSHIPRTEYNHETYSIATSSSVNEKSKKTTAPILKIPKHQSVLKKNSKTKKPDHSPTVATLLKNKTENKTIEKLMHHNQVEISKCNSSVNQIEIPETTQKYNVIEKSTKAIPKRQVDMHKINVQQSGIETFKTTVIENYLEYPKKHVKQTGCESSKKEIKQAVDVPVKHSNYTVQGQDDPFISAIPNSDYDLLDELMDDDLRKEIGELSSDEESYNTGTRDYLKHTKSDEKNINVVYNNVRNDIASKATSVVGATNARLISKQNDMSPAFSQKPMQLQQNNKQPALGKMTPARPAQNKPVICLNSNVRNVSTHVVPKPTQVYNNASLIHSNQITVEPNIYITTVPRPTPVQNVMLIPSDLVYERYPTVQAPIQAVPNLPLNTYIAVNSAPSINMYQATQFTAPVISPLIVSHANISVAAPIVNSIPCDTTVQPKPGTKVSQTEYCYSSHELHQSSHLGTTQGNILVDDNKFDAKATSSVPDNVNDESLPQKTEGKTLIDDNLSKSGERKVLKEVQEKHAYEKIDKIRSQKASDKGLKTLADQERMKKKRLAILNRKISSFCGMKTIALGYSPLQPLIKKEMKDTNENDNKDDLIQSDQKNIQELCDEIKSPATPDSYKENKNVHAQVRRILLRSSNKLKNKNGSPTTSPNPTFEKNLEGSPALLFDTPNETPRENHHSEMETQNKTKRASKRIRNKSVVLPKDTNENETKMPSKKSNETTKVPKKNVFNKNKHLTPKLDFDTDHFFDIEAELLGSTIPKIIPMNSLDPAKTCLIKSSEEIVQSLIPDKKQVESTIKSPEISWPKAAEESLVQPLLEIKKVFSVPVQEDRLQQNKDITVNKSAIFSEQIESLDATNELTVVPKTDINVTQAKTKNDCDLSDSTNIIISDLAEANKDEAGTEVVINEKSQNNEFAIAVKDLTTNVAEVVEVEKEANILDRNDDITTQKQTIPVEIQSDSELVQSDKIQTNDVNTSDKVNGPNAIVITKELLPKELDNTTPPPQIHHTRSDITQNEEAHTLSINKIKDDKKKYSNADSINKKYVDQIKVTADEVNLDKSHQAVAPPSLVSENAADDDDDIQIIEDVPSWKSAENSIYIENITSAGCIDPLKKTVRIKLGNGKTFKGTISGSVNVSNLLEDPRIKAMLINQFDQPKKLYSLKLNVNKDGNNIITTQISRTESQNTQRTDPQNKPFETVSLLSDDEEEDLPQVFETQYGKHKVNSMDKDYFKKHQTKLKLRSYVPVKKLSLNEEHTIKLRSITNTIKNFNFNKQTLQECDILDDVKKIEGKQACNKEIKNTKVLSAIPSKYVQGIFDDIETILAPGNKQQKEEPIVLIDDSSNDSMDIKSKPEPIEKIDELKQMLLKDLGVVDTIHTKIESADDVQVTWAAEAIDLTEDPVMEPLVLANAKKTVDYQKIIKQKCFVKLTRCDGMINQQTQRDDVIDQPKCEPIEIKGKSEEENYVMPAKICRSDSFSILEKFSSDEHLEKVEYKLDRKSPVMEIYDIISSLKNKLPTKQNIQDLTLFNCDAEWTTTKRVEYMQRLYDLTAEDQLLSPQLEVPKLATLSLSHIQREDLLSRYSLVTRFHPCPISLKRKTKPASFPIAKISKLGIPADETLPNESSLSSILDSSATDASNETIVDNEILLAVATPELGLRTDEKMFDITPDLSDTDVSNMSYSDSNDNDDMELIQNETELVQIQGVEPDTGGNPQVDKILDIGKAVTVCEFYNDSEIPYTQEQQIVDKTSDSFNNDLAELTEASKEAAEPSLAIVDDIPIDCSCINFDMKQKGENILPISINTFYNTDNDMAQDFTKGDESNEITAFCQNNANDLPKVVGLEIIENQVVDRDESQSEISPPKALEELFDKVPTKNHHDDLSKGEHAEIIISDCNLTISIEEKTEKIEASTVDEHNVAKENNNGTVLPKTENAESEDYCSDKYIQDESNSNQSNIFIISPKTEKPKMEATTEIRNTYVHVDTNWSDKIIKQQDSESISKSHTNDNCDISEHLDQESTDIECVPVDMSDEGVCFDSSLMKISNENTTHELKISDRNTITKQDINSLNNLSSLPKPNDGIDDALNIMFGEPEIVNSINESQVLATIKSTKMVEEVHNDDHDDLSKGEHVEIIISDCNLTKSIEEKTEKIEASTVDEHNVAKENNNGTVLPKTENAESEDYCSDKYIQDESNSNQSNVFIISPKTEKPEMEATTEIRNTYVHVDTNWSDKIIKQQDSESISKSHTNDNCDISEHLDQESTDIECVPVDMSDEGVCFDSSLMKISNENTTHELKISDRNTITKQDINSLNNLASLPKPNDGIDDALNIMFGEPEIVNSINESQVLATIKSTKTVEEVHNDDPITKPENEISNKNDMADIPQTTDEIFDALKKLFGEPEEDVGDIVITENKISIRNGVGLLLNAANEHHNDSINVSLREDLTLMEDSGCDTVVESIIEMLSDEIIDTITIATLKSNISDVEGIERVNIVKKSNPSNTDTHNVASNDENIENIIDQHIQSNEKTEIKDITYDDSCTGTRYVFSVIQGISDMSNEQDSRSNELEDNIANDCDLNEDMKLIIPKRTYAKNLLVRRSSRNMKRKKDMADLKTNERKYRKGKNIDYPKITASAIAELAYAKEYNSMIDFCSTIKFSYARPFHIECIDVDNILKSWPINKGLAPEVNDSNNIEDLLYTETENTENARIVTDPLKQTLNEEIANGETLNDYKSININETNFNKGFGERSGRVIQKIEIGITKLSAATLSDVKQYQPFLMSEVRKASPSTAHEIDTQKAKLSLSTNLIKIKEKVKSFFKKTAVELNYEWLQDKKNNPSDDHLSKFPFGLTSSNFMEFPEMETVVNVVQVGQLPVNAAAQNPLTCDPRVTHVSDASPSQCSDNSPGVDTQATMETEYTELTTANITLPLVQEYAQNIHQSSPSQEQNSPGTDDDMNATQTLSIVKIELMEEETSQEKLDTDIYENDFSPLPNNNIEYSFEDTSNTLFNTSVNLDNTSSNADNTPNNNIYNTPTSIDNTFTNIFNNTACSNNMDNAYTNMDTTPSSADSTYTNMDNASTSMYRISNMDNSTTKLDNTANIDDASPNMDNTNIDNAMNVDSASTNMENSYNGIYNPMDSDSTEMSNINVGNTASDMNSPIHLENRATNVNTTPNMENANMENTAYDYTYENIEDYAANIENNNNADNFRDVDNYAAGVENYPSNVSNYASNVDNYPTNDENYPTDVENYASNVENFTTNIESYATNAENYTGNIDNANSSIDNNITKLDNPSANILEEPQDLSMSNASQETKVCNKFDENATSKVNQIEHAMNAAGISSESVITSGATELANMINQNAQATTNTYSKSTPINVMTLQQALSQVLPPPLNHTSSQASPENPVPNPIPHHILHIVQGNNSVINKTNGGTHLLHIVQNKRSPAPNGMALVDPNIQQGGNQLIHIVNNGNQNNAQFLKRMNLLTNLTNSQGTNEQKMIQFVCKSAEGKAIQLNAGHQRSMVLRLHPTAVPTAPKPTEPQDLSASASAANTENNQDPSQDIKSRSVYEENYAQFIQSASPTSGSSTTPCQEKAMSLPKFNQVFGKQSYQENQNEINDNSLQENSECPPEENASRVEQTPEVNSPPLLVRSAPPETAQAQPSPAPQMKQTISPMNIHTTMHGGVIYTRQIPVNIGGGQTINLITVPSTELVDDSPQKQQTDGSFVNQEGEQSSIIKLVPHHTTNNANVQPEENNTQPSTSSEANHTPQSQAPPVLTQMRIKLPMLSKGPHIVPGARLVRPSFFQIQRNVIAGTNQPVYQQLVLTTAPSLGQSIRLPAQSSQSQPILVHASQHPQSSPHIPVQQVQHAPSSQNLTAQVHSAPPTPQPQTVPELTKTDAQPNSELSTLTLEQLREFDMVLEQVKERSVQPTPSTADSTDGPALATTSVSESTQQVLYSAENSQPTNVVSYVNRKSTITSATTSFVRSPDSSGIVDTPSSSTQVHITHTVTSKSSTAEGGPAVVSHPKKKKKKKSSSSSSTLASLGSPSKTNALKPQEDEQTTQRILYILAEYKEQVENSPDKNKPAPRRRNQFPPIVGGKRKRSHCSSRATCSRDGVEMSPMHGEHGELGEDSLITLGSEDSSCGTTFSECTDCQESHSPEDTTKVVRRLTFEQETTTQITQSMPQRNVIVGDRQTITVARTTTATTAKPTTTVLMPANYLLPVSMLKGGQQIAIMTNRGPKILVGAGDNNAGALLFQRLIGPGLKPVLTRPGVRHIRLPATALHNLQAFNIQTTPVTQTQPPDSTASQAPTPGPPDLVDTRAMSSPWPVREAHDKPDRGPSPDCTEPWNLPSSSIADDYGYEEIVRTDNMERTVLDAIPDRYSPDMEAQRIFDKMFDVDSKKSMYDSTRCGYDIDTSDGDDKPYPQVVQQRKDGRHHRVTHVSTAALRHKYAILEHELRLQKSLSEECEDLGVDSPSASELFPEADILFGAPSPAHEQTIDHCTTPPPIPMPPTIPQPDLDDQMATDQHLTSSHNSHEDDLDLNLDDVGEIVTVGEDGTATIPTINAEEFARSHPNTTFHTEPEDGEIPPFTIAQGIKGRHITFHSNRVPGTVVMAPQTTVISQATVTSNDAHNTVKFIDIDNMINSMPCPQPVQTVLTKDTVTRPSKVDSLKDTSKSSSKFDSLKEPSSYSRSSSKFDSLKESGSSHRSTTSRSRSKYDSLREGQTSRSYSKFDSLKEGNLAPKPLSKFDSLLTDSKLHLSNSARQVVHSTGHGTQVIRRLRYDERTNTKTNTRYHFDEPRRSNISDEVKMRNDRAMVESMGDNASSPGQPELFWDSTTTERHERRFHFSESEKVAKSPFDELLNDSSAYGPHTRLDSVIKAARPERTFERNSFEGISVSGSSDESRPLRTYPPKRVHTQHTQDTERHFTLKTTTTTTHHHELTQRDRTTIKTTHHHELDRTKKTIPRCQESEGRRRTGRGLVKRGCSCCNGSSAPPKKRVRPKKPPPEHNTPTKTHT